eukprot:700026-Pelagomonas_calceolata.AAC.1
MPSRGGFWGAEGILGAWRWKVAAGEGECGRPGAWQTALWIYFSSIPGFLLGYCVWCRFESHLAP